MGAAVALLTRSSVSCLAGGNAATTVFECFVVAKGCAVCAAVGGAAPEGVPGTLEAGARSTAAAVGAACPGASCGAGAGGAAPADGGEATGEAVCGGSGVTGTAATSGAGVGSDVS